MRKTRPFEEGDICPSCKKARVKITGNMVRCIARQGCLFEESVGHRKTTDYLQLKFRMDLIILNQGMIH